MNATDFLTTLWGDRPPGLIQLWTLADKRSHYLANPVGAKVIATTGRADVYTAVATTAKSHGPQHRARADQTAALAGLWLDIDVNGGPDNKQGAAPDQDAAISLAGRILEPTLIVSSGYGIHAWWLFDTPWIFTSTEDRDQAADASLQWYALHRQAAERDGWTIDHTHDLSRLLRIPGTTNAKDPATPQPVTVLSGDGPHRTRQELVALADTARRTAAPVRGLWEPEVQAGTPVDNAAIDALRLDSVEFAQTWRHDRPEHPEWTLSEYDLALCSIAAKHGWTDQQLAGLIASHRARHHDAKGARGDYVKRTIAKVRSGEEPANTKTSVPPTDALAGTYTSSEWAEHILDMLQRDDDGATPLPWKELTDALDGGLRPGELCLVAGYTSHGKSIVVDQIADTSASHGRRVHIYMTEMTAYQRGLRLLARRSGIPFRNLKRRDLTGKHWKAIMAEIQLLNYGCSIVSDWTIDDVMRHIRKEKWDLAVIDLIHGFHYTDERELSKTSGVLVQAAKGSSIDHTGTAIVAAAHLNDGQMRDVRSPRRPKPGLHSIKGSSSLKQDADIVMFVWQEDDEQGKPTGEGAVWIAKSRQGALDGVQITLDPVRMRFRSEGEWLQEKSQAADIA